MSKFMVARKCKDDEWFVDITDTQIVKSESEVLVLARQNGLDVQMSHQDSLGNGKIIAY